MSVDGRRNRTCTSVIGYTYSNDEGDVLLRSVTLRSKDTSLSPAGVGVGCSDPRRRTPRDHVHSTTAGWVVRSSRPRNLSGGHVRPPGEGEDSLRRCKRSNRQRGQLSSPEGHSVHIQSKRPGFVGTGTVLPPCTSSLALVQNRVGIGTSVLSVPRFGTK